jgi:hypothetical protein
MREELHRTVRHNEYKRCSDDTSMHLTIAQRTPLTDLIEQKLRKQHLAETGALVQRNAGIGVILADELTGASRMFAQQHEGGVLVIGARPLLESRGLLRQLIAERELDERHVAAFGIRRWLPDEHEFARMRRVQVYSMLEISREGLTEMTDAVMAYVRNWQSFHLIVCLDAVDPAFAKVREPCAGGLTSRELIYVLQRLRLIKTLLSVEIVLEADADDLTAQLVSQLIAEL